MPQEHGWGPGRMFVYDAHELEEGLDKHPQLTKDLDGGLHVELRKLPSPGRLGKQYRGAISTRQRPEAAVVWAESTEELIRLLQAEITTLREAAGEEGSQT